MYICTVTGRISKTLAGNIINRGLSHEYLYVNTALIYSYSDGLFCVTDSSKGSAKTFDINNMPKNNNYRLVTITKESVLDPLAGNLPRSIT